MLWYEILIICYAMIYFVKDMFELTVYTCTFIQLCEKNSTISGVGLDFSENNELVCVKVHFREISPLV